MTVAISVTVMDGVVLATDSAASIPANPDGSAISQVYENANKVFQLHRHLPIGAMVWGVGAFGETSVATVMKDWRAALMNEDESGFSAQQYQLFDVCKTLSEHILMKHYTPAFRKHPENRKPVFGLKVAGYSAGSSTPEGWTVHIDPRGKLVAPMRDAGLPVIMAHGAPEPVMRLIWGVTPAVVGALERAGVPEGQARKAFEYASQSQTAPVIHPAMPIQDAIDLAVFLTDLTIKYFRFCPGPPIVGGPIEVAAITKHELFKWIRRKHYYNRELNVEYPCPSGQ